ncbi:MAG: tRNA-(ms[2]io[6]A)-hydroxylase [Myxococcota bacterium]
MLNLVAPTAPEWTSRVLADLDELLLDHAQCEKKAAGMAVQLLFRYPHHGFLLRPLSEVARDELTHFEQVLGILRERGVPFRNQRPSPYAGRLKQQVRQREPERLIDTLLCCAIIEARSCERFALLAEAVSDDGLAVFYRSLLASEARHHRIYVEFAYRLASTPDVRSRLSELSAIESEIICQAPAWCRMHT